MGGVVRGRIHALLLLEVAVAVIVPAVIRARRRSEPRGAAPLLLLKLLLLCAAGRTAHFRGAENNDSCVSVGASGLADAGDARASAMGSSPSSREVRVVEGASDSSADASSHAQRVVRGGVVARRIANLRLQ